MKNIIQKLKSQVLDQLDKRFLGKSEIVDLLGVTLVAGENLFLLGPPGTAKSALVHSMAQALGLPDFEYLLTRFTEPNEIFGPFDIRRLREGELKTNTDGMLPEAAFVFLDELLNANSAILNGLLMILNERKFARGKESFKLPTLMVVGASNHLPSDDALNALFDRFLLRGYCDNVAGEELPELLARGWGLEDQPIPRSDLTLDQLQALQGAVLKVDLRPVTQQYSKLIQSLRQAGVELSDRRVIKLQRCIAASALLCMRTEAHVSDLWILRHIWSHESERELLLDMVNEVVEASVESDAESNAKTTHHRAVTAAVHGDVAAIQRRLKTMNEQFEGLGSAPDRRELALMSERIGTVFEQIQWVKNPDSRAFLQNHATSLFNRLKAAQKRG